MTRRGLPVAMQANDMATIRWGGGSADWEYGWAGGVMPGPGDDVVIDVAGTVAAISFPYRICVSSITLDNPDATLEVTPDHHISVAGALVVRAGRVVFGGQTSFSGTVELAGG